MVRVNDMDRYALVADALSMIDAAKYQEEIADLEAFRKKAYEFSVENGYDIPDYTDWAYSGLSASARTSAGIETAADNEEEE